MSPIKFVAKDVSPRMLRLLRNWHETQWRDHKKMCYPPDVIRAAARYFEYKAYGIEWSKEADEPGRGGVGRVVGVGSRYGWG